ncbi:MAG TPA: diguanylate cyclase [Alphaproteobacteria bacterium]|nr:diguanylate cyclase [Alphaproteobacteria bacterium]
MRSFWRSHSSQPQNGVPSETVGTAPPAADAALAVPLREALIESRQRYKELVEISSDFAWETEVDGRFAFVSPRGALGYAASELAGQPAGRFLGVVDGNAVNPFATRTPLDGVEVRFRRKDGSVAILSTAARPLIDKDGAWRGARGVCRDVTEVLLRDAALARARHHERLFVEIVAAIRDVIEPTAMLSAAAGAVTRAFDAGCRIFRYAPARGFVLAAASDRKKLPADLPKQLADCREAPEGWTLISKGSLVVVSRYRHAVNGGLCLWRSERGATWSEEERNLALAVANQLGIAIEQIANHEALARLSHTDPLTGLLNRRGFFEEIGRRFPRLARERRGGALVYVDLDNFKPVNDRFGHQRGDALLAEVAAVLKRGTRPTDVVARLGGDEFALWLDNLDDAGAGARAALLLRETARLQSFSADETRPLGFSIGIACLDIQGGENLEALTARADAAMYAAKRAGKGTIRIAAPQLRSGAA